MKKVLKEDIKVSKSLFVTEDKQKVPKGGPFCLDKSAGSEFFPCSFEEKKEQREDLKSSCQHVKDQNTLGKVREGTEVSHRTYHFQTRTDIVQRCSHGSKVGDQIEIIQ